ncbi:EAP30 family protein [Tieghemostelium lacteum]|uniref:EAP30 family protein n=1 Tax=Tieghemostelium lacteum TaxID=361077 RepID=A0A151Z507_TIELA|nr:EAP30 family protein [Tieghemostelium lacteum]|eukprot:KYQ89046.1 EAP30 family protein [Tieghemostelium lacteum]
MRRGVGLASIQKNQLQQKQLQSVGEQITAENVNKIKEQLIIFKENLEQFAIKHKKDIIKNPEFRKHFQDMCNSIGVDPLACRFYCSTLVFGDLINLTLI